MNQNKLSELLKRIPLEIVNQVLEYDGRWNIRAGKPMQKIPVDDERYDVLSRIPKIRENSIIQYDSQFGCKTIVWFSCGAQLMYCYEEKRNNKLRHSYVFRMRRERTYRYEHKWKNPIRTNIL
jgi:hypothetical protein